MHELENLRKKKLLQFVLLLLLDLIIIAGAVFAAINIYQSTKDSESAIQAFFCITVIFIFISSFFKNKIAKDFEKSVKVTCINNIIANILGSRGEIVWREATRVNPFVFIPKYERGEEVKESQLFSFNGYSEDDIFTGEYSASKVNITELILTVGKNTTVFQGSFITIQVDKEFQGHTIIGKNNYTITKGLEKLKLPVKEFAKKYDVYTNNFDEAGKILNSDLVNFLMEMKYATKIACYGNKVVAAIHVNKDMFKLGSLFKPVEDQKQFMKFTEDFNWVINIIDKLKELILIPAQNL